MSDLKFCGRDHLGLRRISIECHATSNPGVWFTIRNEWEIIQHVQVDLRIAIQFAKELRREIAKAKEVQNG